LKEGNGFQDWHRDLVCYCQTVYTTVVTLGSFEIQADAEEINKEDINDVAYAADIQPPSAFDNSDGYYEGVTDGDYFD
jgi:hypothetical protein